MINAAPSNANIKLYGDHRGYSRVNFPWGTGEHEHYVNKTTF